MAVCQFCNCDSLDLRRRFQEESYELSWLSQDISLLYEENRKVIEKIKSLNTELENFEHTEFKENSVDDADTFDESEDDEMQVWLAKEDAIRWILSLQVQQLCQDVSHLNQPGQPQLQHRQRQDAAVPRYLWGHQTVRWSHQHLSQGSAALKKARRTGKLLTWLQKRMPKPRKMTI